MTATCRIEVRKGDPGTPDRTSVVIDGEDVTTSVWSIDLVMPDAAVGLPPGVGHAFVNRIPYPVQIRRGPKIRPGTPGTDHLSPGDLVVIAETPTLEAP